MVASLFWPRVKDGGGVLSPNCNECTKRDLKRAINYLGRFYECKIERANDLATICHEMALAGGSE